MDKNNLIKQAESGDVEAMLSLGNASYVEKDYHKAAYWMNLAAAAGSEEAAEWLNDWYSVDKSDTEAHS